MTQSHEITDILKKFSFGISQRDVRALYELWSMYDIKANWWTCPNMLADGFPGTGILDNGDIQDDTLTGADTFHKTNIVFVPNDVVAIDSREYRSMLQMVKPDDLKNASTDQNNIHSYKIVKHDQPTLRKDVDISPQTCNKQWKRGVHTLTLIDIAGVTLQLLSKRLEGLPGFKPISTRKLQRVQSTISWHFQSHLRSP